MNGLNVFGLTLLALLLIGLVSRVERRALWVVLLFLVVPALVAVGFWANLFRHWAEAELALAIAIPVAAVWWVLIGRRLPRPNSDVIRVWGQEKAPRPKPEEARALKSENAQLREQNERLEAELRQLRSGHNGDRPPTPPPD